MSHFKRESSECCGFRSRPHSRREMLGQVAGGFGALALNALLRERSWGGTGTHGLHFPAKAKSVIFLYMDGGPSQVDTFDPKPYLEKYNGKDPSQLFKIEPTQFNNNGSVLASPWKFNQYGQSGIPVSDLFPNVAKCVDELAIVRSMVSEFPEHTFANYFLHTGSGVQGRPSMGAWVNYGLGSSCENLPGFVVLNGGLIPPGGLDCFGSGFLPAAFQGSVFKPKGSAVANIARVEASQQLQRDKLDLVRELDRQAIDAYGEHEAIESAISKHDQSLSNHNEQIARIQAEGAVMIDSRWQQWQTTLSEQARSVHQQQRDMAQQTELLHELIEKHDAVRGMEPPLEAMLQRLTNVDRFHDAAICLTEAVAVLGTQMERYGYLGRKPARQKSAMDDKAVSMDETATDDDGPETLPLKRRAG